MADDAFTSDMQRVLRVARHITTEGKCSVDSVLAAFGLVYGKDFFTHCQTIPSISTEVAPESRKPREWKIPITANGGVAYTANGGVAYLTTEPITIVRVREVID